MKFNNELLLLNPELIPFMILQDFMRVGLKDETDKMRLHLLGNSMINLANNSFDLLTVKNIKKTSGYLSTINDVHIPDNYLRELIFRLLREDDPINLVIRELSVGGYYSEEILKCWLIDFTKEKDRKGTKYNNLIDDLFREITTKFNIKHGVPCDRDGRNFHIISKK